MSDQEESLSFVKWSNSCNCEFSLSWAKSDLAPVAHNATVVNVSTTPKGDAINIYIYVAIYIDVFVQEHGCCFLFFLCKYM